MANLPEQPVGSGENGTAPGSEEAGDARQDMVDLAAEMRGMVTPVIGYLELISQDAEAASPDRHLQWIDTIERRLEAMQELNDQIARTCAVLRESVGGRQAAPPPGPAARTD